MSSHSSAQPGLFDTIHDFVVGGISNDLTEADWIAFERLLRENDDACRLYVEYVEQSDILQAIMDAAPGGAASSPDAFLLDDQESPLSVPVILTTPALAASGHYFSGWPAAYLVATVVFGIALVIGAYTHISRPVDVVHQPAHPDSGSSTQPAVVGQITAMVDCESEGIGFRVQGSGDANHASEIRNHKSAICLGDRLALRSGLLELTYDSGARVVLQGPVTYEVESSTGGYLAVGKLTAKLEQRSEARDQRSEPANHQSDIIDQKFSIRTPTALVTDLGTEFGVDVSKDGSTTSHVFRGSIKLECVAINGGSPTESRILRANESARVAKIGGDGILTVQSVVVDPAVFVRPAELPRPAGNLKLEPFRRWQAYSEQLRKDPCLVAYYDFQQKPGSPSVLPNVAANGNHSLDGVVEGAAWTAGRIPGKQALQFNGVEDEYVRIRLAQKIDNLTLAASVCPYSLNNALNALLMSDQWRQDGQVHWQVRSDGCMEFGFYGSEVGSIRTPATPVLDVRRLFGWTHLAVVYGRDEGRIYYYVNGRMISKADYVSRVPICIGEARIGSWNGSQFTIAVSPNRAFHGRIEELAVFARALTAEEIRRMFEAGNPARDQNSTVQPDKN